MSNSSMVRVLTKILAFVVMFGGLIFATYKVFLEETPQEKLKNARYYSTNGSPRLAMSLFEELLEEDEYRNKAQYELAYLHLRHTGLPLDSVQGFKYLEELLPQDSAATEMAIRIYTGLPCKGHRFKNISKAQALINKCIKSNQHLAVVYNSLGFIIEEKGDTSKAVEYFMKAAKHGNFRGYNNAATRYIIGFNGKKDIHKAIELHKKALELNPNDTLAPYHLFRIYNYEEFIKRDTAQAIKYFNIACDNKCYAALRILENHIKKQEKNEN